MESITIPYSNDSQGVRDGWLVSSFISVPTTNAKSLTGLGWIIKGTVK